MELCGWISQYEMAYDITLYLGKMSMEERSPEQIYHGHPTFIDKDIPKRSILENFGVSKSMVWSAVFAESYEETFEKLAARIFQGVQNEHFNNNPIPIDVFKERGYDKHVNWDSNMSYDEAERIYNRHLS